MTRTKKQVITRFMKMNLIISTLFALLSFGCSSEPSEATHSKTTIGKTESATQPIENEKTIAAEEIKKAIVAQQTSAKATASAKPIVSKPTLSDEKTKAQIINKEAKKVIAKPKTKPEPKPKPKPIVQKPKLKPVVKPKLFFPDTLHNYGFIDEGDTIRHTFRFINDGDTPLEIMDVQVSCGCTIPVYSLEAIQPGRLSKIDITFLSSGKIGPQLATIDVITNASNPKQTLYLKGVIR